MVSDRIARSSEYVILFVCSGNICRSPMAQASLSARIPGTLRDKVKIASAGLIAISGLPATVEAELAARLKGYDLALHRSRALTETILDGADLVLCMEPHQADIIRRKYPRLASRVHDLCSFAGQPDDCIDDPYGGDIAVYRTIQEKIDEKLARIERKLWTRIRSELASRKSATR